MLKNGKILSYSVSQDGTVLTINIKENIMEIMETKHPRECGLMLDDGRHISSDQRKKIYATINDISTWTGYSPEETKQFLKYEYVVRFGSSILSFSDCSVDEARTFITMMLDMCLEHGIILSENGLARTDDIDSYLLSCIKHKKCAVCGEKGEIHHVDAIGMGNNRRKIDDSEKRKICLCRKHHTECHTIGIIEFGKKYHLYGIILEG